MSGQRWYESIVHIYLLFEKLLPSVVVTACCPYNQIRKRRRTRVICMQSVFSIVSCSSNRENRCRVGATMVVGVVETTSRRVRILVTWCNFAPIACICSVFVLGFSSRCQNLNCSERLNTSCEIRWKLTEYRFFEKRSHNVLYSLIQVFVPVINLISSTGTICLYW